MIEGFTVGIAVIIFLQQVPARARRAPSPTARTPRSSRRGPSPTPSGRARHRRARPGRARRRGHDGRCPADPPVAARRRSSRSSSPPSSPSSPVSTSPRIGALPGSLPAAVAARRSRSTGSRDLLRRRVRGRRCSPRSRACCRPRSPTAWPTRGRHDPDRELFGQGLANLASPLFGGMPATGRDRPHRGQRPRRRAHPRRRRSCTPSSSSLVVLFGGPLVAEIPLAALAGVLMVTAVRMVEIAQRARRAALDPVRCGRARRSPPPPRSRSTSSSRSRSASRSPRVLALCARGPHQPSHAEPVPTAIRGRRRRRARRCSREHIVAYRLDGALFFGAAQRFLTELTAVSDVRVVILRLPELQVLDATGAHARRDRRRARGPPHHRAAQGPAPRAPPHPRRGRCARRARPRAPPLRRPRRRGRPRVHAAGTATRHDLVA